MEKYYTNLVLLIDAVLLAACVLLSIIIIVYAILKKTVLKKRQLRLMSLISSLQAMAIDNKDPIIKGCSVLIKETSPYEFLGIARHKENILPNNFSQQLNECINSSGKIEWVEKAAQRTAHKWQRIEALISLGYLKSPKSLAILKKSIFNKDEDIAYFSMLSLGHMKDVESAKVLLEALKKQVFSGYKIASILEHFPESIVEILIEATKDHSPILRLWSIKIISRFKPKEYAKNIAALTNDESSDVRAAACECLGEIAEESTKDTVIKCLNDSAWTVRMHAIRALDKIIGAGCLKEIAGFLKDEEWFVKDAVKQVMISHIKESLEFIEQFLNGDDQATKENCLEILDASGYTSKILEDVVSDNPEIKNQAQRLLKTLTKDGSQWSLKVF